MKLPLTEKAYQMCERCGENEFAHLVDTRINDVVIKVDRLCEDCYQKEANWEF